MNKILIVIDMQNDFITGPLGTPEARTIVPNVKKKIEDFVAMGYDVLFTQDTHDKYRYPNSHEGRYLPVKHCIPGESGWNIVDGIWRDDWGTKICIFKYAFGHDWGFTLRRMKDCSEIWLIGVCTDICVISNALDIRTSYPEIDIIVDASCCAGTTPEKHKAALEVMKSCHIDIINE